ncbi:MAG: family 43 glycosylhydrolase [Chitinophagaceae bacterium]
MPARCWTLIKRSRRACCLRKGTVVRWGWLMILLMLSGESEAQNPIGPEGTFMADPTARVWPDGRLYLYGSTDENHQYWCSYRHDVLHSDDLLTWKLTTNIFTSKGKQDSLPQGDPLLFAPDAIYRNGKYYLFFCTPDTMLSEGVAVADRPEGPFGQAKAINTGRYKEIDPTVFIDDDGQAYYYWGQYSLKGAKLKAGMTEIDTTSVHQNLLSRKEHFFHEGSFVFKRNGIYYAVFADESRRDRRPTCLGYATASSPLGPFTYRGIIIDNYGCDPETWNNHGSVAEYKGQWYVFYHRSSQGTQVMRRACMEPISFNEDGTINEVEMTSQGAGKPLSAFQPIEAERACLLEGYCRIRPHKNAAGTIADIKNGDKAAFKYIDFGKGATSFSVSAFAQNGGEILLHDGTADGPVIGKLTIPPPARSEAMEYRPYKAKVSISAGVNALWLEFRGLGNGERLFNMDKFWFE